MSRERARDTTLGHCLQEVFDVTRTAGTPENPPHYGNFFALRTRVYSSPTCSKMPMRRWSAYCVCFLSQHPHMPRPTQDRSCGDPVGPVACCSGRAAPYGDPSIPSSEEHSREGRCRAHVRDMRRHHSCVTSKSGRIYPGTESSPTAS